ncbi:MAG: tetratricopeptide repeat protein, partial [Bacteroidales bacterium]|nr:tetratricopeptide repeat protein [Bacteroidales bacterium]
MKKIISIAILALLCNIVFAQTNIDAIYDKAESLINTGNSYYDDFKYSKALEYYKQAADLTKNIDNGYDEYYAYSLNNIGSAYY